MQHATTDRTFITWLTRLPRSSDTERVPWPHTDDVNHCETFSLTGIGCPMLDSGLGTAAFLTLGLAAGCEWAWWLRLPCFADAASEQFSVSDDCTFNDNRLGSCSVRFDRHATPSGRLNTTPSCSMTSKAGVLLALSISPAFLLCTADALAGTSSRRELEVLWSVSTVGRSGQSLAWFPDTIVAFFGTWL